MLDAQRMSMPLIPPRFEIPGPYKPGMQVPITLPLHNLRAEEERDVDVHFQADGARIEPQTVHLESIAPYGKAQVDAIAHILPTEEKRDLTAVAIIKLPGREPLYTAQVRASIVTHPRISIDARATNNETTIVVKNDGTAPTMLRLFGVASDTSGVTDTEGRNWSLATENAGGGRSELVSDAFEIGAGDRFEIHVPTEFTSVRAVSIEGERAFTQTAVGTALVPMIKPPELDVVYAPEGVRNGDVLQWYLPLENPSGRVIHDVMLEFTLPASLELLEDSLAIDNVRVRPNDIAVDGSDVMISIGRLDATHTTMLQGVFISHVDRNDPNETLSIRATIKAATITPYEFGIELPIDRRPAFATTQTYLGAMRPAANGTYLVDATVTNAESCTIERARIRWELAGVLPLEVRDSTERELVLQPGSYRGNPCLITDLAKLEPHERRTVTLHVEPTLAAESERAIAVGAALLVDSKTISLGLSKLDIAAQPDLHSSKLSCQQETLRTGIPRRVELSISNTGASAAQDIRLALDVPDGVVLEGLRQPEEGSRWIRLAQLLPPGSSMMTSLLVRLVENPRGDRVIVRASLDASNLSQIDLPDLVLETPSSPLLQQPEVTITTLDHGMLRVKARLANLGDGSAQSVVLRLPPDDHTDVVNGTTTIDGVTDPVPGLRSPILTGMPIGSLDAGSYREVEWTVSPDATRPYRATLIVEAEDAHGNKLPTQTAQSAPRMPRAFARLATALPEARKLSDTAEARAPERTSPAGRVTIVRDELASAQVQRLDGEIAAALPPSTASTNGTTQSEGAAGGTTARSMGAGDAFDVNAKVIPPDTQLVTQQQGAVVKTEVEIEEPSLDPDDDARSRNFELLQKIASRSDAGMLPHILAARLLVADVMPDLPENAQDALREIHDAVAALCGNYRRFIYAGSPDRRWLLQLDAYDAQILPAVQRIIEARFADQTRPAETVEELDTQLPVLHAVVVTSRGRATNDRLEAYSDALANRLTWSKDETPRLDHLLRKNDEELDRLLSELLANL